MLRKGQYKFVVKLPALGKSTIEWQIGNVIVLEGKEQFHFVRSGNLVSYKICLLSVVYCIECISDKE